MNPILRRFTTPLLRPTPKFPSNKPPLTPAEYVLEYEALNNLVPTATKEKK